MYARDSAPGSSTQLDIIYKESDRNAGAHCHMVVPNAFDLHLTCNIIKGGFSRSSKCHVQEVWGFRLLTIEQWLKMKVHFFMIYIRNTLTGHTGGCEEELKDIEIDD